MIDACARNRVKLMTAYRLHFERANLEVAQLARSGKLGNLRYFSSNFSQQITAGNVRLKAKLGGGPLPDMGIYCINAARSLFAAEPFEVLASAASPRDARVIHALTESLEAGGWVKLEMPQRKRRPTMAQEIRRPGIRPPALVHAASPSG